MFDIGWSELLVVAVVMILVVGPKDLPGMLRAFGKTMGQVRRTANDFKRQFNDALREAENDTGLKETSDQLKSIGSINPMSGVRKELDDLKRDISVTDSGTGIKTDKDAASDQPKQQPVSEKPASGKAASKKTASKKAPLKKKPPKKTSSKKTVENPAESLDESGSDAA